MSGEGDALTPRPPLPNGRGKGTPREDAHREGLNYSPSEKEGEGEPTRASAAESAHASPLIGEVVESATTEFLAQAIELDAAPPFGALVEVATDDALTVYGVVARVQTAGIDPGARAIMRGHGDVRDERIYEENPDLPLVLRTTFRALVVGFADHDRLHQFLPPRPPRLHYSVFTSQPEMVRQFTSSGLDYLQALLNATDVPVDELLAANLRYTAAQYGDGSDFMHLQQAGRELAQLLRADYARLTSILRRCLAPIELT